MQSGASDQSRSTIKSGCDVAACGASDRAKNLSRLSSLIEGVTWRTITRRQIILKMT